MEKLNLIDGKKHNFISGDFLYILKNSRAIMNNSYLLEEEDIKEHDVIDSMKFEKEKLFIKINEELYRVIVLEKIMYYFYKSDLFIINLNMNIKDSDLRVKFKRFLLEVDLNPEGIDDENEWSKIVLSFRKNYNIWEE
jgi:hypothetical protein